MSTTPNAVQSQPTPPAPAPQEPMLAMIAPNGTSGSIPQSKVAEAIKSGGKLAVHMTAPDGSKGVIPFDQQDAAQKAGGKWDVNPENDAAKNYLTDQSVKESRSGKKGKAMVPVMGEPRMMMVDVPEGQEASTEKAYDKGQEKGGLIGAGLVAGAGLGVGAAALPEVVGGAAGALPGMEGMVGRQLLWQGGKWALGKLAAGAAGSGGLGLGYKILKWTGVL